MSFSNCKNSIFLYLWHTIIRISILLDIDECRMMNSEYVRAGGFVGGSTTQMWLTVGIKVGFVGDSATRLWPAVATNDKGCGGMAMGLPEPIHCRAKP